MLNHRFRLNLSLTSTHVMWKLQPLFSIHLNKYSYPYSSYPVLIQHSSLQKPFYTHEINKQVYIYNFINGSELNTMHNQIHRCFYLRFWGGNYLCFSIYGLLWDKCNVEIDFMAVVTNWKKQLLKEKYKNSWRFICWRYLWEITHNW